ncbi:hypothetical protein SAMN05421678_11621 [Actinopolymorpha cephalotaxi]|uniref:Uncharacterized protein n=1 Tax=Actinopolymorpha cephalotaxi TaxID=504797 RepID=A0A1I2ZCH7_9ACTN|nr:hypothetical protein [Actinopolymorpha cephalotaxi]NYH81908.1 hypothetical protein [Actinopolymorpha cephalotaxi]SFH35464.1 hypothetical protein SAMN05421678_11621 [Actinopolymorpha cephalotaxi]
MELTFLVLNLLILAITLESDLGVRRIRWFRVLRPAVSALVAVPFFFRGMDTSPWGLLLEAAALALGLGLGYGACRLMTFRTDPADRQPRTEAGWRYALAWSIVSGLKILPVYAVTTWFSRDVGRFMIVHQLSPNSIRAAFVFLALGSPLVRPAYLWIGGARHARSHGHALHLFRRRPEPAPNA